MFATRLFATFALAWLAAPARAADQVAFGLDWLAEAEYGGYYQAVAQGIYARHGLDVTIRQGGPQVNQAQLPDGRPARLHHCRKQLSCA